MYKIVFFVPETHKETVKQALFDAGAGRIGNYDSCAWETLGTGQFRAMQGANPFLGKIDQIEKVDEYRVELVCEDALIKDAMRAMKAAHPYEEPAYDVIRLAEIV